MPHTKLLALFDEATPIIRMIGYHHQMKVWDVEELVQNVFVEFFEQWSAGKVNLDDPGAKCYLGNLAKWRAKDQCRIRQRHQNNVIDIGEENNMDDLIDDRDVFSPEQREIVDHTLAAVKEEVSEKQYQIFADHFLHNKSVGQTAVDFGMNEDNVYLVRHRVCAKVKKKAKELLNA